MRERIRALHDLGLSRGSSGRSALGFSTNWHVLDVYPNGRTRRDPCVAEVNLCHSALGTEVVAHEMFHATICWGRRIGFDWKRLDADDSVNDEEERMAYAHGKLMREFVSRAYAAGLYP